MNSLNYFACSADLHHILQFEINTHLPEQFSDEKGLCNFGPKNRTRYFVNIVSNQFVYSSQFQLFSIVLYWGKIIFEKYIYEKSQGTIFVNFQTF